MRSILPGAMLGLLGGGQLGRMFVMAAHQMGYQVTVLDSDPDSPAGRIADQFICAEYTDRAALQRLGKQCAAITTEFENIPAAVLAQLSEFCIVSPDAKSVSIAQNRISEKQFLQANNFSIASFAIIEQAGQFRNFTNSTAGLFPGILKVSQFGYDGKGQKHVNNETELSAAFVEMKSVPCVLEKKLPLKCEVSVVLTRGGDGKMVCFPVVENQHMNGVLDISIVPARVSAETAKQALEIAGNVADTLNYRGVLCVEFFLLEDGQLVINEIAPRPHNSGHFSIDACITSQFEQQVRALCELPLGNTALHKPSVMVNLLGDLWQNGEPDWLLVLQQPSTKLHLYGKRAARPGRKMGHFTVLGETADQALTKALHIKQVIESN
ncbi:5-(carboxyamino)imidazole ribonucleotide synthase [Nitrosomonas aestuarii]|uniref:5-(carboxyamino)imidazole ribonucleotide synthase n=1 Tax=Nitrosomonas aestuarii TaxID=52441 RepID=UPI000D2FB341|nr:5-(carboxyamino)imidazole ribonucleotide synthase [Nitrosomonas aestuarii]